MVKIFTVVRCLKQERAQFAKVLALNIYPFFSAFCFFNPLKDNVSCEFHDAVVHNQFL